MENISKVESKEELASLENGFADMLTRAFMDDPYYSYIMPNAQKREAQMQWWMTVLLKYTLKYGDIIYTDDHKGVAMWLGPEKPMVNDRIILSMGLIQYPFRIGLKNFRRLLDISEQWGKEHKKMKQRHYYLMVIGVEPEFQGKGIGSRLMQVGLQKADNDNLDSFLETVTEVDVRFYEKFNYKTTLNQGFAEDSQFWLMKRDS